MHDTVIIVNSSQKCLRKYTNWWFTTTQLLLNGEEVRLESDLLYVPVQNEYYNEIYYTSHLFHGILVLEKKISEKTKRVSRRYDINTPNNYYVSQTTRLRIMLKFDSGVLVDALCRKETVKYKRPKLFNWKIEMAMAAKHINSVTLEKEYYIQGWRFSTEDHSTWGVDYYDSLENRYYYLDALGKTHPLSSIPIFKPFNSLDHAKEVFLAAAKKQMPALDRHLLAVELQHEQEPK